MLEQELKSLVISHNNNWGLEYQLLSFCFIATQLFVSGKSGNENVSEEIQSFKKAPEKFSIFYQKMVKCM